MELVHCDKTQEFRGWTEVGSVNFARTFLEGPNVAVLMKRLGAFVNPRSAQQNMFVANRAKRETCADGHIATSGEDQNSDGPTSTLDPSTEGSNGGTTREVVGYFEF
jgi:hypothetical protein